MAYFCVGWQLRPRPSVCVSNCRLTLPLAAVSPVIWLLWPLTDCLPFDVTFPVLDMRRLWSRANRRPLHSKAQTVKLSHFLPLFRAVSTSFVVATELRNGVFHGHRHCGDIASMEQTAERRLGPTDGRSTAVQCGTNETSKTRPRETTSRHRRRWPMRHWRSSSRPIRRSKAAAVSSSVNSAADD